MNQWSKLHPLSTPDQLAEYESFASEAGLIV